MQPGRHPSRALEAALRRSISDPLTALDLDPVLLSEVLEEFGRHRLLSFDRDPVSDEATVEVAHEALLTEWVRLAGRIDRHRADLRRHQALGAAIEEWEASGQHPDYLLAGSRLGEYEAWRLASTLRLTAREREFLDAEAERQHAEQAEEMARRAGQRRLKRRARTRLLPLVGFFAGGGSSAGLMSLLVLIAGWCSCSPRRYPRGIFDFVLGHEPLEPARRGLRRAVDGRVPALQARDGGDEPGAVSVGAAAGPMPAAEGAP
jgi:hypothetical protein